MTFLLHSLLLAVVAFYGLKTNLIVIIRTTVTII